MFTLVEKSKKMKKNRFYVSIGIGLVFTLCLIFNAGCGNGTPSDAGSQYPTSEVIKAIDNTPVDYPFSFVIMGDTRPALGHDGTDDPDQIFSDLRSQTLDLDPRPVFTVNTGDVVPWGRADEYTDYLKKIESYQIPLISVIGNHEMMVADGRRNYLDVFGEDAENFYFDYGNCRFIFMNNALIDWSSGKLVFAFGLTGSQLSWLENLLDDSDQPDKFIFMHVPPPIPDLMSQQDMDNTIDWSIEEPNWNGLMDLVEQYGVKIASFGHIHNYAHTERNGVHYIVSGGGGAEVHTWSYGQEDPPDHGAFNHFVVVTINEDGNSTIEVVKRGDGIIPDSRFTLAFSTSAID